MTLYAAHPVEPLPMDVFRVWCPACGGDQFITSDEVWAMFNYLPRLDADRPCDYCDEPLEPVHARLERWSRARLVRWGLERSGLDSLEGRP